VKPGPQTNVLYTELAKATGKTPSWNFNKYLITRDGKAVTHYGSNVTPQSVTLVSAVEKALAVK
jgi:glutathione peroxidase